MGFFTPKVTTAQISDVPVKAAAGAGIPEHLHIHVIPRWEGDTNFMPLVANTKQISYDIQECYQKLKEVF